MRSRIALLVLSSCLVIGGIGCNNKPASTDNGADAGAGQNQDANANSSSSGKETERKERKEAKREHLVVPSGTAVTINLGTSMGSNLSQPGQTSTGSSAIQIWVVNMLAFTSSD